MIRFQIREIRKTLLIFEVVGEAHREQDTIQLDEPTSIELERIMRERPFKPRKNDEYSLYVIATEENNQDSIKRLTLEIRRGKSRVKRKITVPKLVFLKFWNYMKHQTLPSGLPENIRVN